MRKSNHGSDIMVETILSKLQNQVIKLEKDNLKLRDLLAQQKDKNKQLQKSYDYLKKNIESKIEKVIEEKLKELTIENEKLKEENEKLKRLLNHNSDNTGIPTSKTKIGDKKRIPNTIKPTI